MAAASRPGARAPVRIVVCGPAGAGKTCFVTAAATETFPERVPPHVPPTLLHMDALPDRVPALLVDTSSRAEDRGALAAALSAAHAVVLCYAADAPRAATLSALRDEWLPELRRAGGAAPVILLGCRLDERAAGAPSVAPIAPELFAELPRLQASLECSAKTLVAVHEAVYAAHRAVLYPTAPLFDAASQALTADAVAALRRIFCACDADTDGALSSSELNAFQEACFGAPLSPLELEDVRRVVSERLPAGTGVTQDGTGLTLAGFLYLHAMFIEHGRADTVWAVLRCFGYDSGLRLSAAALGSAAASGGPLSARPPDASVELSERATAFVDAAFARATAANHGALQAPQLDALFATAPGGAAVAAAELGWTTTVHWEAVLSAAGPGLSRQAFEALWALSAALRPRAALEHLVYLGFAGNPNGALCIGKRRAVERARRRAGARGRSTVQAFVCGPPGAGKSALLSALAHLGSGAAQTTHLAHTIGASQPCSADAAASMPASGWAPVRIHTSSGDACFAAAVVHVAAEVLTPGGVAPPSAVAPETVGTSSRVTLILRELAGADASSTLASPERFAAADILLFVFDARSRSSFTAAADELAGLAARGKLDVPALLVATHADMHASALQSCNSGCRTRFPWDAGSVDAFCASLGVSEPVAVVSNSPGDASMLGLFARVVAEALAAEPAVPETRAAEKSRLRRRVMRRTLTYAVSAAAVVSTGVVIFQWFRVVKRRGG
jgi:Ras family protein T1